MNANAVISYGKSVNIQEQLISGTVKEKNNKRSLSKRGGHDLQKTTTGLVCHDKSSRTKLE